jgi:linearmycin/streptolysin S transport system ATP-binding protein
VAHILEADNLVKKYGETAAVAGISFDVEEGEVFGLLGPNGAGKTTTISMLTGVLEPTAGTARIGGHDILAEPRAVKQLNGLVPQDLALYPTLSARANLQFFGRIYGLRGKALRERVDDVLEIVALADRADEPIEKYSGGMKRRVNIAAGLVHQPRLLFLDEPTVGVDPQSRNHIFESVQRLNRDRGMSIIYTSHYMEEVELLCNRVAIVDQGRIIALDTIRNLIAMLGGGVIQIGLLRCDDELLAGIRALPAVVSAILVAAPVAAAPPDAVPPAGKKAEQAAGKAEPRAVPAPPAEPAGGGPVLVKIEAKRSQDALVQVIGLLNDRDIVFTSIEIFEPNLESVFLHLTGKKLRE